MRYISENEQTELYCIPFVKQYIQDIIKNTPYVFRHIPNKDDGASAETNGILLWLQYNHIDIVIDFKELASALIDMKGTLGLLDKETGEVIFPGYYKLTMEMYCKYEGNPNIYKSWPFIRRDPRDGRTTFTPKQQNILYISELMAILIPKVELEKVMKNPKYKYKFDTTNIPWKLNYSDKEEKKYVKNIVFDLNNNNDIDILLEVGALFHRLIDGHYVKYDPLKIKPQQIRKDYIKSKKEYIIKNK